MNDLFLEDHNTIPKRLRRAYKHISRLITSSQSYMFNIIYYNMLKYDCFNFFDFDVICGGLPTVALYKWLIQTKEKNENPLNTIIGQNTINHILGSKTSYCLPPGCIAEMFKYKNDLTGNLSKQAQLLLKKMDKVTSVNELSNYKQLIIESREDILGFSKNIGDMQLLKALIDKSVPFEYLISKQKHNSKPVFIEAYGSLSNERPNKGTSNRYDALNFSFVFDFSQSEEKERGVPFLISETQSVLNLNRIFKTETRKHHCPDNISRSSIVNDMFYFVLHEKLMDITDRDYHAAHREVSLLLQDAHELESCYRPIIDCCNKLIGRGKKEEEIIISDFSEYEWESLLLQREMFSKRWGSLFFDSSRSAEYDRLDWLNFLQDNNTREVLLNANEDISQKELAQAESFLKSIKHPDHDLWQHIQKYAALNSNATEIENKEKPITVLIVENTGALIHKIDTETNLNEFSPIDYDFKSEHDLRFLIKHKYFCTTPLLGVDSFCDPKYSQERYISVIWVHGSSLNDMVNESYKILYEHADNYQSTQVCSCTIMSPYEDCKKNLNLKKANQSLKELLKYNGDTTAVQMQIEDTILFLDNGQNGATERQAYIIIPERLLTKSILSNLSKFIHNTILISENTEFYFHAISEVLTKVNANIKY